MNDRAAVNLMHLVSGRTDLSTASADHDPGCSRIQNEDAVCNCSTSADICECGHPHSTPRMGSCSKFTCPCNTWKARS